MLIFPKPAVQADARRAVLAGIAITGAIGTTTMAEAFPRQVRCTGVSIAYNVCVAYRLENGQIVEHWHNIDELGLLRQLGVVS